MAGLLHGTLNVPDHELEPALKSAIVVGLDGWKDRDPEERILSVTARFDSDGAVVGVAHYAIAGDRPFIELQRVGPGAWSFQHQMPVAGN